MYELGGMHGGCDPLEQCIHSFVLPKISGREATAPLATPKSATVNR